MRKQSANISTKQRIIETAGNIFADVGFQQTTVREICKRADVNIAAVNYHFGDKKKLYLAVLKYGKDMAFSERQFDEGLGRAVSAEERFRLFVAWYIGRVRECHEGEFPWVRKLIAHELLRPTEGLNYVAEQAVRPIFTILSSIVRDLLGKAASESMIRMCCMSVVSQALFLFYAQPMITRLFPGQDFKDTELIADHITKFSLSGIRDFARHMKGETA